MTSSPNPSGVPPTPSAVTPGLVVVAGLLACWLTEDPLVLRTAATVATMAALIALVQLTRNVSTVNSVLSAELRTQNRDIARLRDAVNELHEQLGDQQEGVEQVRREAMQVREQAAQVREEAAALLEAADSKVGSLGGGSLASAYTGERYAEPLTGPRQAFASPPVAPTDRPPQTFDDGHEPSHAPFAGRQGFVPDREPSRRSAPEPPSKPPSPQPSSPAASPSTGSGSDDEVGYLEDFSIQRPDDEPLTGSWQSAESEDAEGDNSTLLWGFADADRGADSR